MKQVKWGIIGLGGIASKFADGFQFTKKLDYLLYLVKTKINYWNLKTSFKLMKIFVFQITSHCWSVKI